jgi:hypothetical protein
MHICNSKRRPINGLRFIYIMKYREEFYLTMLSIITYTISSRWIKYEYGELVEHWQGKTEVLDENLPQCHFVNHKSHTGWPGIEPQPPLWQAVNYLPGKRQSWSTPLIFTTYFWNKKQNVGTDLYE